MKKNIAILPGDGIGLEITREAQKVLDKVAKKFGHEFSYEEGLIGAVAIDKTGDPLPEKTLELCLNSDAVLFGAIGDPKYDNDPTAKVRPEQGLLKIRKELGLYANVRPIYTFESLIDHSPLKPEIIKGADFVVIRELTGGLYFGEKGRKENGTVAYDTNLYSKEEIERVAKFAFELAARRGATRRRQGYGRQGKLTLVDKANVLETSRLWRETVQAISKDYADIAVDFMFIDNASMQVIKRPTEFDVILTENTFGDILTDEASVITGSIGMLPSASIGAKTAVYEPIHGSYPKAAGQNTANPTGSILSAAMLLDYSFGMKTESQAILDAVQRTVDAGFGTKDLFAENPLSTTEYGNKILESLKIILERR